MTQGEIAAVVTDAVVTILTVSLPMLGMGLVVGLVISILQATTQINEQTLAFVPKIIAILLSVLVFGAFILTTLIDFTLQLYESINSFIT